MSRMCVAVGGCVYHCVQKGVRTGRIIEAQYILAEQERTPKALGLRAGHPFRCLGPGVVPATTGPAGEGPCADYLFYPAALGHVLCNTQSYERGAWSSVRSQASLAQHLVLQHGQPLARPTGVRHQSLGHTSCLLDLCVLTAVFLRISFDSLSFGAIHLQLRGASLSIIPPFLSLGLKSRFEGGKTPLRLKTTPIL